MFKEIAICAFLTGMYAMERSQMRGYASRAISRSKFLDEKKFVVKSLRSQNYLTLGQLSLA